MKVLSLEHVDGYRILLRFSDGSEGIADLEQDLTGPLAPLRDVALFRSATLVHGAVTWNEHLDLATELVYARAHGLPPPRNLADVDANEQPVRRRVTLRS